MQIGELAKRAEVPAKTIRHYEGIGIRPEGPRGPLGFQAGVFESPAGEEGHTSLRRAYLITWKNGKAARLQKSAKEIQEALGKRDLTIEDSGRVVNTPFLTWPGGRR